MRNTTYVHKYLSSLLHEDSLAVDMTAGGGSDTLFLAQHAGRVYAFDISQEAIEKAKKRCIGYENITFICADHSKIDDYLKEQADLFLFNLGYYPYGDKSTPTRKETTLIALEKSYSLLKDGGCLVITSYRGHPGGKEEYEAIKDWIEKKKLFLLESYREFRHEEEPVTFILKKPI